MHKFNTRYNSFSEEKLLKDLKRYLCDSDGSSNEWKKYRDIFLKAKIPITRKVAYLKEVMAMHHYDWARCIDIIDELPRNCETVDELINHVIPIYLTSINPNLPLRSYLKKVREFVLAIEQIYFPTISKEDFCRIINIAHNNGSSMAIEFAKQACLRLHFAKSLFSYLHSLLQDKHPIDVKPILAILEFYFKNAKHLSKRFQQDFNVIEWPEVNDNYAYTYKDKNIILILQNLVLNGVDANEVLQLLMIRPGVVLVWDEYVQLIMLLAQHHADKDTIRELLQIELGSKKIISYDQVVPIYKTFTAEIFGRVFYLLATNDLLPDLKFNDAMRESIFAHILALPKLEKTKALARIKNYEDTQLNNIFWQKPNISLFCDNKKVLPKRWRERIDILLETKTLQPNNKLTPKKN